MSCYNHHRGLNGAYRSFALLADLDMLNGVVLRGVLAFVQLDGLFVCTAASALFLGLTFASKIRVRPTKRDNSP